MKKNQKGFTLIELLVVIAIIGLLATLAVVSLRNAQQRARDTKRVSDISAIETAVELFYNENNGVYPLPTTWAELQTALAPYIKTLPVPPNPAQEVYVYAVNPNTVAPFTARQEYIVKVVLEDTGNNALRSDFDGTYGVNGTSEDWGEVAGDIRIVYSGTAQPEVNNVVNCGATDTAVQFCKGDD